MESSTGRLHKFQSYAMELGEMKFEGLTRVVAQHDIS